MNVKSAVFEYGLVRIAVVFLGSACRRRWSDGPPEATAPQPRCGRLGSVRATQTCRETSRLIASAAQSFVSPHVPATACACMNSTAAAFARRMA
jgi:hypothetical protein